MPKRNSQRKPPAVNVPPPSGLIVETRHYKVITPLYGGGAEPAQPDPITVVRASAIRGHLRFWWRATRGGAFDGNLRKMKEAEDKIWGSEGGEGKAGPSKVLIRITRRQPGKSRSKAKNQKGETVDYGDIKSPYGYVAFPLRKTRDTPAGSVWENVAFDLEIRYAQDVREDVLAALWAWETFGGIGARTRRGFGALQLVRVDNQAIAPLPKAKLLAQISNQLRGIEGTWPPGVPHLSSRTRFVMLQQTFRHPDEAWRKLFTNLQRFRQQNARYDRKSGERSDYGLSRWPEANAIRQLLGLRTLFPAGVTPHVIEKFPRGAFGLPIGFEMHHDGDRKLELLGCNSERLASPLILRPIACAEGAAGLALILEWTPLDTDAPYVPPGGLRLQGEGLDEPVESQLTPSEAAQIPVLHGETDVLQAFLNYLKGK